ncbi:glycoside hydrolase family 13 protein [Candidatus Cetobacterium colombiensis]|uniref:Alpha-glucosidase n=1 Tax=Candidatus Cetobacterium colombiensis TaxID=3073100 RepID=A0ABU4WAH6_9FUSO|nr:alpha-glucosidase [Candidatus Cetobacterium colombiensis]MDX8336022.1 alpha-glucosidase [Candidatus Cetobacterium colombiensis]
MWWKELVGYQIYPRSFKDSNGDGIGDLNGIIEKLDYLKELGIDLIWVSPFFKSPNDDNGYDISDYRDILEEFGTMQDFDKLLAETHKRDMKLIIDLVINHTSDEHPWFIEARESKDSPKRDWYIWKEGKDGEEPNNWESIFKGSAWEKCEKTEEYYLHLFSKKQPDLNWENEEMRKEIYNMMNWWLDKGIDGFRVDAISHIKKADNFPDMPNPHGKKYVDSFDMHMNVDGIQKYLKELKEETFDKYNIVTVGEANGVDAENSDEWVGAENGKFNMIFQFEHLKLWDYEGDTKFCPKSYKDVLNKWQLALEGNGWNALFIENHDIPRSTSTWGNDGKYWLESAKAFATTYFLQKGTPFIYQGQEIGMTNTQFNSILEFQDVKSINEGKEKLEAGMCEKEVLEILSNTSRDNSRTPMQWNDTPHGGFTNGKPWLKVNENYKEINVEKQLNDKNSIYNHYKNLISLKKGSKTLTHGKFKLVLEEDKHVFAYLRELDNERYLVLSNLSENEKKLNLTEFNIKTEDIIISNYKVMEKDLENFVIRPYESVVYKI